MFFIKISAQTEVQGIVISDTNVPVVRANIILLNAANEIETFGFSDKTGSFSVYTDKFGTFKLQIKSLNYDPKEIEITIIQKNKKINLGNITISQLKESEIKEVIITRKNPIRIKKDTVEYTAEKFASGTEMNVEELLKKLPGITVESDGKIKFGDQEVERVLIENDDLFERGYQTLTQNMPSKSLDKVQVLKNYSKNKLLKDIQRTEGVAINLTLKEDAKGKWTGNLMLASTSYVENMHQGKINLMNFTKRRKLYVLYNQNNLGLNEMNGVKYLINPSSEKDVENLGANLQNLPLVNLHQKNHQFEDNRTNFNNDRLASLSYIYNFRNDWKIKLVSIFNETENRNYINSLYRFNYNGISFTNVQNNSWKQNNQNIVGKIELSKEFKKQSTLVFYNKTSSLRENNNNDFVFNDQINEQVGENRLFSSESSLVFTKKLDSSRAFVAVGKHFFQERPYNFTDENNVFQLITGNAEAQLINQQIFSSLQFGGAKVSYLKKYSEHRNLELQLGNEFQRDYLDSHIRLFNFQNQAINFDDSEFLNNVDLSRNNVFAQARYNFKRNKWKYNFALLSEMISSNFNGEVANGLYLSPNLSVSYELKSNQSINFFGSRRFSETRLNNVHQNYIYQGNRLFRESAFGFEMLPDIIIGVSYSNGDELTKNLRISLNYIKNEKFVSNNVIVNPNYSFHQNILVNDNETYLANFEARRYLKFIKSRFSLLGNFMLSSYQNSVNNQPLIKTQFTNYKIGFEMKSGWLKKINYELGYDWAFNTIKSDVNSNDYLDQKGFFNLYYNFDSNFRIQGNLEYYHFGSTPQKSTQFLDMKGDYTIKKIKANVFLRANNLLNSSTIQRYSLTNVSESIYTQRLMPRHVVLGINKNF